MLDKNKKPVDNKQKTRMFPVMETEKEIFGVHQKIIAAVLYVDPDDFPLLSPQEIEQKACKFSYFYSKEQNHIVSSGKSGTGMRPSSSSASTPFFPKCPR